MSDIQVDEFRSRVDRIKNGKLKSKRAFYRDQYGVIVTPKKPGKRFNIIAITRSLLLLYIAFTVLKAVVIYNSDQNDYAQIIANLESGDSKSQFIAYTMMPGYFTEPVGMFVGNLADKVKNIQ